MLPLSESRLPLFGREAELELLTGLLDAVQRSGAALVLRGEPGIGKSRLLAEAMSRAGQRNMSVLATRAVQSEARLAFAGLQQLLRPARSHAAGLSPAHRSVLDAAFGIGDEHPPEHFRIALAVLDLLSEAAASALATNVHRVSHAALGFGRPQRCWRSLRMRARSRRWAASTSG